MEANKRNMSRLEQWKKNVEHCFYYELIYKWAKLERRLHMLVKLGETHRKCGKIRHLKCQINHLKKRIAERPRDKYVGIMEIEAAKKLREERGGRDAEES